MVFGAVVLAEHVDLHLAEIARKGDLRGLRQVDVTEQNQLIVEEGFIDLGEQRRRYRLFERDAGDLAAEHRMQRLDLERPIAGRGLRLELGLKLDLRHDVLPDNFGDYARPRVRFLASFFARKRGEKEAHNGRSARRVNHGGQFPRRFVPKNATEPPIYGRLRLALH